VAAAGEPSVTFHESARREARDATRFYIARDPRVAERFVAAVDHAVARIAEAPQRWPPYLHGTRRYVLSRFPFEVVYRATDEAIQVVAVAHTRRKPGYWRRRKRG
jgi:plasmid stabilization system protein ParE